MIFEKLSGRISDAFRKMRSKGKLTEQDIKDGVHEIKLALLEADVNFNVVQKFIESVQLKAVSQEVLKSLTPSQQIIKIVNEELIKLMGSTNKSINFEQKGITVIMMCGLQGSGKTTHSAKLAYYLKQKKKHPMLVACDIYRPAAIEQLQIAGERANVFVFEQGKNNPVEIAQNAVEFAKNNQYDIIILDTAGRLHIDEVLMNELKEIKTKIKITETLLTVDAMSGQDAANVAKIFDELISIDGIILTKLDSDARGGAAFSVVATTHKPIKFVGTGEKLEDLDVFFPERMASRILGMGDMLSLIEKAEAAFDEKQKQKFDAKFLKNKFDLNDLLAQMKMVKRLGSLKNIVSMLPGIKNKITDEQMQSGEKELVRVKALIYSMTPKEREKPEIIDASRKKRIAAGSGHKVEDLNKLLKQYKTMNQLMKCFKKQSGFIKKHS